MVKLLISMLDHSAVIITLIILLFITAMVLYKTFVVISPSGTENQKPQEAEEPEEFAKITIYSADGKMIEEHTAKSDSVDWSGDSAYIEFETQEGKNLTFMVHGFLVKIEDL